MSRILYKIESNKCEHFAKDVYVFTSDLVNKLCDTAL